MSTEQLTRHVRPLAAFLVGTAMWAGLGGGAAAQSTDAPRVAAEVHRAGRYPSDILVQGAPEPGQGAVSPGGAERSRRRIGAEPVDAPQEGDSSWLEDMLRELGNALDRLFGGIFGVLGEPIGWLIVGSAVALLVAVLVYGVVKLLQRAGPTAGQAVRLAQGPGLEADPFLAPSLSPSEELARAGRYREAIHALFVEALTRSGALATDRRGRTARELVRGHQASEPSLLALSTLLGTAELVWFGGRPATLAMYEDAVRVAADVESPRG